MRAIEDFFLRALRCGLRGQPVEEDPGFSGGDWENFLQLAAAQELLPLAYEAVYRLPSFRGMDRQLRKKYQEQAVKIAIRQMVQSNEFLSLLAAAPMKEPEPVVLKGIVCRSLYPIPALRPSVDEDLLVTREQAPAFHEALLELGLTADEAELDPAAASELSYHRVNSPTYIELHTSPFPPESAAYGDLNELFTGYEERCVPFTVEDVTFRTLSPTDHMLYLICHAFKHFLHSGVGIRQIADIGLFCERYASEIDWAAIHAACESRSMAVFAACLLRIAYEDLSLSAVPEPFASYEVSTEALLEDVLSDGSYGTADLDRARSSTVTLEAVAARHGGRKSRGALSSLFPAASSLQERYPYLRTKPWLLPVAWTQRIIRYAAGSAGQESASPSRSLRIARERVELLKQYKIIS